MKLFALAGLLVHFCIPSVVGSKPQPPTNKICTTIAQAISPASEVFYPGKLDLRYYACRMADLSIGDPLYNKGIYHAAISSTQYSKCVVEAGTPADVGKIVGLSFHFIIQFFSTSIFEAYNLGTNQNPVCCEYRLNPNE